MKKRIILTVLCAGLVTIAAGAPIDTQTFALTAIDVVPTKDEINAALMGSGSGSGSQTPAQQLEDLAANDAADTGVRLRAINVLPQYCPCAGSADAVRLSVRGVIAQNQSAQSGANLVLLRAAIESLGALYPKLPDDYAPLKPLLNHTSRDIRAATARAIAGLCNTAAINDLRVRYQNESTDQVKLAISETLRILSQGQSCQ